MSFRMAPMSASVFLLTSLLHNAIVRRDCYIIWQIKRPEPTLSDSSCGSIPVVENRPKADISTPEFGMTFDDQQQTGRQHSSKLSGSPSQEHSVETERLTRF